MRNLIFGKSKGSVESFLTLIPQVFVFLIMFQLVFMQFKVIKDTYLTQGSISKIAIAGDSRDYVRHSLIGGGSLIIFDQSESINKFVDFGTSASRKIVAIAVDEDEHN